MKLKKILCVFLTVLMVLPAFLTGCAKEEPAPVKPDPTQTQNTAEAAPTQKSTEVSKSLVAAPKPVDFVKLPGYDGKTDLSGYEDAYEMWNEVHTQRIESGIDPEKLIAFTQRLNAVLAKYSYEDKGNSHNLAWSPVNVYIALAMLAEVTDGETRAQVLSVLGTEDMNELRENVKALLFADHYDDGKTKSLIADSLWLNSDYGYNAETLESLAEIYRTSSYWGDPKDAEFVQALKDWLNDNTGGLLEDSVKDVELDPETVLAICSTIWFKGSWGSEFSKEATEEAVFHSPLNEIVKCQLMHKGMMGCPYYEGEGFTAVWESIPKSGNGIWYLLPDEGVRPEDLIASEALASVLDGKPKGDWDKVIHFAMPRFDIKSDLELIPALMELGVTDCFDYTVSDFTPLTADRDDLYVGKISHSARVKADEEGIEAAAFTVIDIPCGAAAPEERQEIYFTLDRPFVFIITGVTGAPLFIGVVNVPNA